uniref:Endoplasmic reticulum-based factor for assembly of V-ATPase n=1 Tax=Glossina brevipalpis TaxID=37001 RepID=A0A1A9W2U4_9MUSC
MTNVTTIKDTRIRVKISRKLFKILEDNIQHIHEMPEDLFKALQNVGFKFPSAVDIIKGSCKPMSSKIDIKLLKDVLSTDTDDLKQEHEDISKPLLLDELNKEKESELENDTPTNDLYLYLNELHYLRYVLEHLRKEAGITLHLNDILEISSLELPQNEIIERNPVLEARCQRLRKEQENREYAKMTKNVDSTYKHYPEDTIAYQIKALNSQIIAVLQFVFSVAAGFVFGFLGIELIIGNLDFGLRLLLGIMFALIIALAEIYFLAKKLNEYDNTTEMFTRTPLEATTPIKTNKLHTD